MSTKPGELARRVSGMPEVIGVVGAGTMGAGIAQLAAAAGARTLLHDPVPEARERGAARRSPTASSAGGRRAAWSASRARSRPSADLAELAPAELVIEAAPERLELKRELFARARRDRAAARVLASNTSSIPITAIAGAAADPGRVVGMHFFNPAPVMRLVEVIAGIDSSPEALDVARATGRAMGKARHRRHRRPRLPGQPLQPARSASRRCKLLQERVADVEAIDASCALGGGFRMGPFELQDLVGIDIGFEVSLSFYELSFGEPRWRPSPLSARMVAAGRLGRKTGRGWYEYPRRRSAEDPDPPPPGGGGRTGWWSIAGEVHVADELRALAAQAGFDARDQDEAEGEVPWLLIDARRRSRGRRRCRAGPVALLCADGSLHALDGGGGAVGFHVLPPLDGSPAGRAHARAGHRARRPPSAPRSSSPRSACAPCGSATRRASCSGASSASSSTRRPSPSARASARATDVDAGMVLGLNHPRGPLAWCEAIGARARPRRARRACASSSARSATARRRCCAGWPT